MSLPRVALNIPTLDLEHHRIDIQELSLTGLDLPVRVDREGRIHALGFSMAPAPAQAVTEESVEAMPPPAAEATTALAAGGVRGVDVGQAEDRILPLVTLRGLDVGLERLSFVDERGGESLEFGLALRQEEPLTLLAPDAADLPPLHFQVVGAARPIVDSIALDLEVAPFATEPTLDAHLKVTGVQGGSVTRVFPGLAESLDGSAWVDGRVEGHLQVQVLARRRGPLDFDFAQGLGLEVAVDRVALHATPDGPALVGFEELTASVASIRPETGDVHVKRVEWVGPFGSAWKDADGIHAAGWVLKAPVAGESIADAGEEEQTAGSDRVQSNPEPESHSGPDGAVRDSDPAGPVATSTDANESVGEGVESNGTQDAGQDTTQGDGDKQVASDTRTESERTAEAGDGGAPAPAGADGAEPTGPRTDLADSGDAPNPPEIRVDEVLISGGTFRFEDRTVEPRFDFPIDDVDLEVRRFTTRTLTESAPFGFRLALYGGEVELRERMEASNLVGGILGSVAALAGDDEFELE
ncbi:MAG: DUF748 domain-containing protein, partial [Planctomycetes bacterium]|nr:DUF748 domain-containing protein [Planctomycetota bacterium]